MFLSVLLNISLVFVPFLFYSFCGMMAFSSLTVLLPKLFSRSIIQWPVHSAEPTQRDFWYRNLTGDEYCERGLFLNPANATTYTASRASFLLYQPNGEFVSLNMSHMDEIYRSFHNVILDCPDFHGEDKNATENDNRSMTFKYLKLMATFNSRQNASHPKLKAWLLLHPNSKNGLSFENLYCTAVALAANRLHSGTVQGLVLHGEILSPLLLPEMSMDWGTLANSWLNGMRRLGFSGGVMLNLPSCTSLGKRPSLSRMLDKFDAIYYYRNSGGAFFNLEEGATAIISKKYHACKSLVAIKSPNAVEVKHALPEIHLMFRRFSNYGNYCIVYDWIVA